LKGGKKEKDYMIAKTVSAERERGEKLYANKREGSHYPNEPLSH